MVRPTKPERDRVTWKGLKTVYFCWFPYCVLGHPVVVVASSFLFSPERERRRKKKRKGKGGIGIFLWVPLLKAFRLKRGLSKLPITETCCWNQSCAIIEQECPRSCSRRTERRNSRRRGSWGRRQRGGESGPGRAELLVMRWGTAKRWIQQNV